MPAEECGRRRKDNAPGSRPSFGVKHNVNVVVMNKNPW